jgi:hypothetical protein
MGSCSRMLTVETTLHEEKVIFLTLETTVSVQIQPIVAHFKEVTERNLQKEKISLVNHHTHNFPYIHDEMAHYDID